MGIDRRVHQILPPQFIIRQCGALSALDHINRAERIRRVPRGQTDTEPKAGPSSPAAERPERAREGGPLPDVQVDPPTTTSVGRNDLPPLPTLDSARAQLQATRREAVARKPQYRYNKIQFGYKKTKIN
eukprot:scaffold4475_cov114-Isochrysis_galbana.AAC.13